MARVFMVGWDGATFDLVRPWVEQGKLPHLARVMERGIHGPLRSTLPPWSYQAWSSFITGKNPGKHGIFDFFRTPPGTYQLEFVNARHRRGGQTFWQILSEAGRQVVAISIPGTFPPDPVNGVMISGFDFPGEGPGCHVDAKGMYPPEFYDELLRKVGKHPIDPPIMKEMEQGRFDVALERILDAIRRQTATAEYLLQNRPWDCFMFVFSQTDGVSHYFWQFCDPTSPYFTNQPPDLHDSMLRVYQEIDAQTGKLLDQVPADTTVMVLSDHGSGGISEWVLFPNCWLLEKGYLRFRGANSQRMSRVREALKNWGRAAVPSWVQRRLYRSRFNPLGKFEARVRYGTIDWENTRAYFDENPYFPVLRINLKGRQPRGTVAAGREYETLRDDLIRELEAWRHPVTGTPLVEKAYRREEVYSGPCVEEAADVIPKWALQEHGNLGFQISSKAPEMSWLARIDAQRPGSPFFPRKFSSHRDDGIFLAQGPEIHVGASIQGARIIDLAPTILSLLGVRPPKDMDGRVLVDLFREGAIPIRNSPRSELVHP